MTYLIWHYTSGFRAALAIARDLNRFVLNFFSLPVLLQTLFSPWRRLSESYAKGLSPSLWLQSLTVNLLMRLVGAVIRSVMIIIGGLVLLTTLVLTSVILLAWLILPVILISLIVGGLFLITN